MHVSRLGFAALKGTRHLAREQVTLTAAGVIGDRALCLVDPVERRVLRTIENPSLLAVRASYDAGVLVLDLPDGTSLSAPTADSGDDLKADYWGRPALLRLQDGPHAGVLGRYLGREVALARIEPGEVVYGGPVTLVGTTDLRDLAAHAGEPTLAFADARFRASITVHSEEVLDEIEPGSRLRVGDAVLEIRAQVPRCAVADLDPATGSRNAPVIGTLAGYRRRAGEVWFGLDAVVVTGGAVRSGDPVALIARED